MGRTTEPERSCPPLQPAQEELRNDLETTPRKSALPLEGGAAQEGAQGEALRAAAPAASHSPSTCLPPPS